MNLESTYKEFLNAYWLRPESAMWRSLDVQSMESFEFESPSLDLGCGDGTFSFLRAGGAFDISFDVFSVKNLDEFFDNVDVYDAYVDRSVKISRKAEYQIDIGLDHKETLMKKAAKLGLYKEFVVADANKELPFENDSFNTVFSNIIYWLDNPHFVFEEIRRILKPGGKCCIMLPGLQYLESSFYYKCYKKTGREEMKFLELIDRGRFSDNLKVVKSQAEWEKIIFEAGLRIEKCVPHLSTTLIQIWDVGLRPLFPVLKKMVDEIEEGRCQELKKEWIDLFQKIGLPIIQNDSLLTQGKDYCFYCYILSK